MKSDTRRGPEPGNTWTILEVKEIPEPIIGERDLARSLNCGRWRAVVRFLWGLVSVGREGP